MSGEARTVYDRAMADAYVRGRGLSPHDAEAWMTAARAYLPDASGYVLDLGAGTGRFSTALARTCGASVVACEPAEAMRTVCRSSCPPSIAVIGGRAEALPLATSSVDAVWASQVVHHVTDLPAFARELRRVLRPGSHVLLRGGFGPPQALPLYRYFPSAWAPGVAARLSLAEVTRRFAGAGLRGEAHIEVAQTIARDGAGLLARVRTRSLSPLAGLAEAAYRAGLRRLDSDVAQGRVKFPLTERLDLVVFRS